MRTLSTSCKQYDHILMTYSGAIRSVSLACNILTLSNSSRSTRELHPPATGDKVFGPSNDPRPHCVKLSILYHVLRSLLLPITLLLPTCCLLAACCMSHIFTVATAHYIAHSYHHLIDQTSTTRSFVRIL